LTRTDNKEQEKKNFFFSKLAKIKLNVNSDTSFKNDRQKTLAASCMNGHQTLSYSFIKQIQVDVGQC
jgi:hypothetical protein